MEVTTLSNGTRVIDCGAQAAGGFEAGRCFAEICMAGLGSVAYAPLVLDGRWLPGAHGDHRPARGRVPGGAVRRLADRSRRLLRDGQRARARADPRRGALRRPRLGRARERRRPVPGDARAAAGRGRRLRGRARRRAALGADAADGADGERGRRRADRGAGRRDRAAQAPRARLRRAAGRRRLRQLPAAAGGGRRHGGDRAHQRRRALRRPGPPHGRGRRRRRAARRSSSGCPPRPPSDYGEPFGKVLKAADFDFYEIDPLLFSPAQIRLTSVGSGRSFEAGRVNLEVLERSFWG